MVEVFEGVRAGPWPFDRDALPRHLRGAQTHTRHVARHGDDVTGPAVPGPPAGCYSYIGQVPAGRFVIEICAWCAYASTSVATKTLLALLHLPCCTTTQWRPLPSK